MTSQHDDCAMSDLFATLDNIQFDFQSFTLQGLEGNASSDTHKPRTLPSSRCIKGFLESCTTSTSSSQHMGSSSYVVTELPSGLRKPSKINDETTETEAEARKALQDRIHDWLSQIPDRGRVLISPLSVLPHDCETPSSGSVGREEVDHLVKATRLSDATTVVVKDGSKAPQNVSGSIEQSEAYDSSNHGGVLNGYHSALLHIHMISTPITGFSSRFHPSMRRQYPRGFDEEAHSTKDSGCHKEKLDKHQS